MNNNVEIFKNEIKKKFLNSKKNLFYHNFSHTIDVLNRVNELGYFYELDDLEIELLQISALGHDVGFLNGDSFEHENRSCIITKEILENMNYDSKNIEIIISCILSTTLFSKKYYPKNIYEKIIADCDTYSFGSKKFVDETILLLKEEKNSNNDFFLIDDEIKAYEKSLNILYKHKFHTNYCINKLQFEKKNNILRIKNKIKELKLLKNIK